MSVDCFLESRLNPGAFQSSTHSPFGSTVGKIKITGGSGSVTEYTRSYYVPVCESDYPGVLPLVCHPVSDTAILLSLADINKSVLVCDNNSCVRSAEEYLSFKRYSIWKRTKITIAPEDTRCYSSRHEGGKGDTSRDQHHWLRDDSVGICSDCLTTELQDYMNKIEGDGHSGEENSGVSIEMICGMPLEPMTFDAMKRKPVIDEMINPAFGPGNSETGSVQNCSDADHVECYVDPGTEENLFI